MNRSEQPAAAESPTAAEVRAELADLADPRVLAVKDRQGDDPAVNLTKLHAIPRRLKKDHDLARELWATGDSAAKLLALLVCRPKTFERDELDAMIREARTPKVQDWLVNNVVKKSAHTDELRRAWHADSDPLVESAGWALTADRVAKKPDGLDLPALLDDIELRMAASSDRLQW